MPNEIIKFVEGFENKFQEYLSDAIFLQTKEGKRPPIYTKNFSICTAEKQFSDWDLECNLLTEKINMDVLTGMHEYIHTFESFTNSGDFTGNRWFQVMAFIKDKNESPFVDIHLMNIPTELIDRYLDEFLGSEKTNRDTADWILLTWLRKLRNNDQISSKFVDGWIKKALTREQFELFNLDSEKFTQDYFAGRGYDKVLEFLNLK